MQTSRRMRVPKKVLSALVGTLALFGGGLSGLAMADDATQSQTVQGLTIYYGIVPAAIVNGHPPTHAERTMHGGVPQGQHAETILKKPGHGAAAVMVGAAPTPKYPPAPIERTMGATSVDGSPYHLVVAIFDATTGARLSDATVGAEIFPQNQPGTMVKLEPMRIADTTTYGGFFQAPDAHHYTIRLTIQRAAKRQPVIVTFEYSHS